MLDSERNHDTNMLDETSVTRGRQRDCTAEITSSPYLHRQAICSEGACPQKGGCLIDQTRAQGDLVKLGLLSLHLHKTRKHDHLQQLLTQCKLVGSGASSANRYRLAPVRNRTTEQTETDRPPKTKTQARNLPNQRQTARASRCEALSTNYHRTTPYGFLAMRSRILAMVSWAGV